MLARKPSRSLLLFTTLVLILSSISFPRTSLAYSSGSRWSGITSTYKIDSGLGFVLGGLPQAQVENEIIAAANQWNKTSRLRLIRSNNSSNFITARNFQDAPPCNSGDNYKAVVCVYVNPTDPNTLRRTEMYFNNSNTKTWNVSSVQDCSTFPERHDVRAIALHELGHFFYLQDYPLTATADAVMDFDCTIFKPTLRPDDIEGATQMYGPQTGFETGQLAGRINKTAHPLNTVGRMLGPTTSQNGVQVFSGSYYNRLGGTATAPYSYAYMTLTSSAYDITPQAAHYLKIQPGMKLKWRQYNYQQSTMSVDATTTDGRELRNSNLVDRNGVSIHPAARGGYPTGVWLYFEVDLTPLAGAYIADWMIAYDNGNNGITGPFRGYFDSLEVGF